MQLRGIASIAIFLFYSSLLIAQVPGQQSPSDVCSIAAGCGGKPWISGYVLLPDETLQKAKGIEIRLMVGAGGFNGPTSGSFSGGAGFGIPTQVSIVTDDNGRFSVMDTAFQMAVLDAATSGASLFLNIKLDGYAEIFQRANLNSSNNVIMLNRGPSDGFDMTYREPLPLTQVEKLRSELVSEYGELGVREYEAGLRDMLNHKSSSAIDHFEKSAKAAPHFFDAWMELGSVERDAQQPDRAEKAFRQAVATDPNSGEALIALGTSLLDQATALDSAKKGADATAKYSEAVTQIQSGLAKEPWAIDGHYYLGSALYKLSQLPAAESELLSAISATQPRQDARLMLVNVYKKEKRYADALAQLDAYTAAVPDSSQRKAIDQMRTEITNALQPVPAALAVAPSTAPANQPLLVKDRQLEPVIQRAIEYVANYESALGNLIGTEDYDQVAAWNAEQTEKQSSTLGARPIGVTDTAPARRTERRTISDFLLIKVGSEWAPVREVNILNGQKIQNNPNTFPFGDSPTDNARRLASMKADSTKYNLGDVVREMNLPTFALEVLRRDQAPRFDFQRSGSDRIAGVTAWKVKFRENRGRALVTTAKGQNLYANGFLWIDPDTGTVVKTEFNLVNRSIQPEIVSQVTVTYSKQAGLDLLAPSLMIEHYEYGANIVDCKASYSNFRPFTVNVQFESKPPGKF